MTLMVCEIGVKPGRHAPYRMMWHRHHQMDFGYIPSDILGTWNIRLPTSR